MFDFDVLWYKLSTYERGKPLEHSFAKALAFYGLFVTRNCTAAGADFVVGDTVFELKNWSGCYWISPPLVKKNILSRFLRSDPSHSKQWVLVMTGSYALSLASRQLLASCNIRVVDAGEQVKTQYNEANCINKLIPLLSHILSNDSELNIVECDNNELKELVLCGESEEVCLVDYSSIYLHELSECFLYNS
jgi:hypothetical protein